jgi:hypothetical protein
MNRNIRGVLLRACAIMLLAVPATAQTYLSLAPPTAGTLGGVKSATSTSNMMTGIDTSGNPVFSPAKIAFSVANNTELSALNSTAVPSGYGVQRLGYAAVGDSPAVVYTVSNSACSFNSGAGDGGSQVPTNDGKCFIGQITAVDNRIWGAKNDATSSCVGTDDTAADQYAINYAVGQTSASATASLASAAPIYIGGLSLISSPLYVNRAVGSTRNAAQFFPAGTSGGFCTASAIRMFETNLSFSEDITFNNVQFQASNSSLAAYVLSQKFIRPTFNLTTFNEIKAVGVIGTSQYLQSWTFNGGSVNGWSGTFFGDGDPTNTAYALRVIGVDFESGGNGFTIGNDDNGVFIGNTFEGSGQFLYEVNGYGVTAEGNYFEGNSTADFVFADSAHSGVGSGIKSTGNTHLSVTVYFPEILGNSTGAGSGNYASGSGLFSGLYDDSTTILGKFTSTGDSVASGVISNSAFTNHSITTTPTSLVKGLQAATAYSGGGQANATLMSGIINNVATCTSSGTDSVKLPPAPGYANAPYVAAPIWISNQCGHTIYVYPSNSDVINGAGYVTQASGAVTAYINDAGVEWFTK